MLRNFFRCNLIPFMLIQILIISSDVNIFGTQLVLSSRISEISEIALLKQYRNDYKSGVTFDYELIQTLLEETGDAPGSAPSSNTTEISGYIDWINEEGSDPYYSSFPYYNGADYEEYCYGWGIIDGYEMYKYFRQNY